MTAGGEGLTDVFRHIENARSWAINGDYEAARNGYQNVMRHIQRSIREVDDQQLRRRWVDCVTALQKEAELVSACEDECKLVRSGPPPAGVCRQQEEEEEGEEEQWQPSGPQPAAKASQPVALEFDTSGGRATPVRLVRAWGAGVAHGPAPASSEAMPTNDPDVWAPPPPRASPTPCAHGPSSALRARNDRAGEFEVDHERRSSGLGAGPSRSTAGPGQKLTAVKAKVNTGARVRRGGEQKPDAKCAVLDTMMARFGGADQELVEQLGRDMLDGSPGVNWDDIAGLEGAKRVLKENVTLPLIMPSIFKGSLRPVKGVLLYGPPGTGKTLLAKAVATECSTAFFNVSTSTLASKYRGESEKLVRVLFEMARAAAPAVIFIDEIDSLCSTRGAANEHEASRRMKTELLTQIDGMHSAAGQGAPRVMVLAATNYPWAIDEALRRRLEKRVYIPLPGLQDRRDLLALCLKSNQLAAGVSLEQIAELTEGFSGDDISNVCREAAWEVVRRVMAGRSVSSPSVRAALQAELESNMIMSQADFLRALERMNPSCSQADLERHESFAETFGST